MPPLLRAVFKYETAHIRDHREALYLSQGANAPLSSDRFELAIVVFKLAHSDKTQHVSDGVLLTQNCDSVISTKVNYRTTDLRKRNFLGFWGEGVSSDEDTPGV